MRRLPDPAGPNSERAVAALLHGAPTQMVPCDDPFDRDTQLAWFVLNEASFAGWDRVDDSAEWNNAVVSLRQEIEQWFHRTVDVDSQIADPDELVAEILSADGPSMSRFLAERGTVRQVAESMLLRYPYQHKEADPHTFAIPRLSGTVKRALCEIQSGEYGVGHRSTHAELFVSALEALGHDNDVAAVCGQLPGIAFVTSNLVTMGGLNRAMRGVAIGQLALFEMDSVSPNGTMVEACDRLELPAATRRFFDVHVMADAEHELIARQAFLIDYPVREPEQVQNLLFGIRAQHAVDIALADHAIGAWTSGRSALIQPSRTAHTACSAA